jgi:hypothetical protein
MRIATATRWQIPSLRDLNLYASVPIHRLVLHGTSPRVQQDCGYTVPDRTRTAPVQGVRRELGRQAEIERLENLPVETCSFSSAGRECSSEHGPLAYRLFFRHFILNDVPMLDKDSVLNAHNICRNPIHRSTETAKSPVHDHEVSLSHDRSRFVLQRWREALDTPQPPRVLTPWRDQFPATRPLSGQFCLAVKPFIDTPKCGELEFSCHCLVHRPIAARQSAAAWPRISSSSCHEVGPSLPAA